MNSINDILLNAYGATVKNYKKGELIFVEGNIPRFYYQIAKGKVKVFCINADCKELTLGIFNPGESFGEPPLFLNYPYPSCAMATENCEIIRISKEKFLELLDKNSLMAHHFIRLFAARLYEKTINSQILHSRTPEEKIIMLFKKQKKDENSEIKQIIPFTRQQIANMTGLRVETVIRAINKLSKLNKLEIIDHKVYF
ncbi:MAG: Crp/Fnr family transcriptional regulator [Saprospiraceae bacterium]|nr:Crp/Fnr family transcriptional regulator [Saprospiraceae bacterium]